MTAIRNTMLALGMLLFLPACAPTQEGPGADDAAPEVAPEAAEWTLYRSPSHGYALWYPSTWILDDTGTEGPPLRIDSPDWEAVFIVSSLADQRLAEPGGRIFVSTAHIRSTATARYGEILDEMIGGFDALGVGGEEPALALE